MQDLIKNGIRPYIVETLPANQPAWAPLSLITHFSPAIQA